MEAALSRDGTRIAYHRRGAGPPLIRVPGTGAANPVAWTAVLAGQQHIAMYTAPALFLNEVLPFLLGPR